MPYDAKITGRIIGTIRTRRALSQEALSGLAGVARSHLSMIENGGKRANVDTLWRIAQALGMRLSDLIRLVEDEIERQEAREKGDPPRGGP